MTFYPMEIYIEAFQCHTAQIDAGCRSRMRVLLIVDATTEALLFGLPVGVEKMDMKRSGVLSRIINPMNPVKRT